MTVIVRTAPAPSNRPDLLRRTVTGTPAEVTAAVQQVRARGFLLGESLPQQVHGDRHRVQVLVTLSRVPLVRPTTPVRPSVARRAVKPLAITGGVLAGLGGIGFGLYLLTQQTIKAAAVASPTALGVLVIVFLVLLGLGKRKVTGGCSGLHCGGCDGH